MIILKCKANNIMRMCTVFNWSKMRSPMVGVYVDGDEAASGSV